MEILIKKTVLFGSFKNSCSKILPIRIPNFQAYTITEVRKNTITSNFELQFKLIININTKNEVNNILSQILRVEIEPPTFRITHADVYTEIMKLKNKKAPGNSRITNEALKNLPTSYIPKISLCINSNLILVVCLFTGKLP